MPAETLFFDFQKLKEEAGEIHLTLFALPRETVAPCLDLLNQAGLSPASVELAPSAAANAFAALGDKLHASWMLVHLDGGGFELTHIAGQALRSIHQVRAPRPPDLLPLLLDAVAALRLASPTGFEPVFPP